jgi:hypothetical protein
VRGGERGAEAGQQQAESAAAAAGAPGQRRDLAETRRAAAYNSVVACRDRRPPPPPAAAAQRTSASPPPAAAARRTRAPPPPAAAAMALNALLKGRVALVTGSSTGIGAGILQALSAAGATTVLHGLAPRAELEAKAAALAAETGGAVGVADADLRDPAAIRAMVAAVQAEYGALDIL